MSNTVLQLAGSTTFRVVDGTLWLYSDRVLKLDDCPPRTEDLLRCLERGATPQELIAVWTGEPAHLEELLGLLMELAMVVPAVDPAWQLTPVSRQVLWFGALNVDADRAQRRLAASHVAIWGVGGIGGAVLQYLAGAGVRRFSLFDHDTVCADNFNRQFIYSADQIGSEKVLAAASWLRRTHPLADATATASRVESVNALMAAQGAERWDCLVVAADEPPGRVMDVAAGFCQRAAVPIVGAACGFSNGSWGPLLQADDVAGWRRASDRMTSHAARPMPASFGPTTGIVASFLARDVVLFLAGLPVACARTILTIDFESLRIVAETAVDEERGADG